MSLRSTTTTTVDSIQHLRSQMMKISRNRIIRLLNTSRISSVLLSTNLINKIMNNTVDEGVLVVVNNVLSNAMAINAINSEERMITLIDCLSELLAGIGHQIPDNWRELYVTESNVRHFRDLLNDMWIPHLSHVTQEDTAVNNVITQIVETYRRPLNGQMSSPEAVDTPLSVDSNDSSNNTEQQVMPAAVHALRPSDEWSDISTDPLELDQSVGSSNESDKSINTSIEPKSDSSQDSPKPSTSRID
ncbi:uncharacterized protein LOC128958988 [Oppia nitens]|uniref:uncharacterized protein LOC128958988 n=1 Tax=Oppia nitens TaxID=1686743 RepID=UPI0023DC3113|nr:uncharacterized protein LOC128958988 [Oppia nitens]